MTDDMTNQERRREIYSIMLEYVNLLLLAVVFYSSKSNIPYVFGGTITLIIIPPFLIFFSVWFKRCKIELNLLALIVICTLAWQCINYYDLRGKSHFLLLTLFLLIESLSLFLLGYVLLKPLRFKNNLHEVDFTKEIKQFLFGKYFLLVLFPGVGFSFVFARIMLLLNDSALIRNHIISFAQVGVFIAAICNLICYFNLSTLKDKYLEFAYQKRGINIALIRRFAVYLLTITFVLGSIIEVLTRKNAPLFLGTYLFITTAALLLWRIYKTELFNNTVDIKDLVVEEIKIDYRFIFKYIIVGTVIAGGSLLSFIFLLMEYCQ